jgi:mannobiose 2-epimerase
MNTHLHVVEGYANLYTVHPTVKLKQDIQELLLIFDEKIINKKNHHLGLFFSEDWKMDDRIISYGHDIEAGWLLQSCAESIQDTDLTARARKNAIMSQMQRWKGWMEVSGMNTIRRQKG